MRSLSGTFLPIFVACFFLFLYIPIIILIVFSFNASSGTHELSSFSFKWYRELFKSPEVWAALINSLIVACSSVILSISMAVLLVYYSGPQMRRFFGLFYGSLLVPEIVLAVGMLGFFSLLGVYLGFATLIVGHTLLGLGYAVPLINGRYSELERQLSEASLDLGATRTQTFFRIILPLLRPAVLSAAILIFVISLDDFLIAFFCAGPQSQTLPLYIFSVIRSGGSPLVNALSTVLIAVGSLLVMLMALLQTRKNISFFGS